MASKEEQAFSRTFNELSKAVLQQQILRGKSWAANSPAMEDKIIDQFYAIEDKIVSKIEPKYLKQLDTLKAKRGTKAATDAVLKGMTTKYLMNYKVLADGKIPLEFSKKLHIQELGEVLEELKLPVDKTMINKEAALLDKQLQPVVSESNKRYAITDAKAKAAVAKANEETKRLKSLSSKNAKVAKLEKHLNKEITKAKTVTDNIKNSKLTGIKTKALTISKRVAPFLLSTNALGLVAAGVLIAAHAISIINKNGGVERSAEKLARTTKKIVDKTISLAKTGIKKAEVFATKAISVTNDFFIGLLKKSNQATNSKTSVAYTSRKLNPNPPPKYTYTYPV